MTSDNEMNNQAAQTMPELPKSDRWGFEEQSWLYTDDQMHQYARDYAAMLAAAPVASGGECNCASGRGSEHCVVHANTVWDQPQTAPEPLAQGAVACHRVRIKGDDKFGPVWRDGDIPQSELDYWTQAGSEYYIERAYASPQPAANLDRELIGEVIDNLRDTPVNFDWATRTADKLHAMLTANPPQPSASVGDDSIYSPVSPEEEEAIDLAAGIAKVVLRLPIDLLGAIDHKASQQGVVRNAYLREHLAVTHSDASALTTAAGGVDRGALLALVDRWRDAENATGVEIGESIAIGECADELQALIGATPTQPGEREGSCTCPSGDGSLTWPCPRHPRAEVKTDGFPMEPLKVFDLGPWVWTETGHQFTGIDLDGAAFVAYRDYFKGLANTAPGAEVKP